MNIEHFAPLRGHGLGGALLIICLLPGCRTIEPTSVPSSIDLRAGNVLGRVVNNLESARYPVTVGVRYTNPVPVSDNPVPQYPAEMLGKNLAAVEIQVRLIVDERGGVTAVHVTSPVSGDETAFVAELKSTLATWRFTPLVRFHSQRESADGSSIASSEALPFHLDYVFTFQQIDGVGRVDAN